MACDNGIIRGGGNALFVVKMDLISIWCIVLPLSFLGLIAAAAGLEQAAGFLLHLANIPCEALLHSLRWLQAHAGLDLFVSPRPHWTAILGLGAIAVALAMRVHRDHFPHAAKRLLISGALGPRLL